MNDKKKLNEALWKKAVGYTSIESVDELTSDGGGLTLSKQRITTKEVPADMTALKLLIEQSADELETLTDEELENEKIRLIKLLKETDNDHENKKQQNPKTNNGDTNETENTLTSSKTLPEPTPQHRHYEERSDVIIQTPSTDGND